MLIVKYENQIILLNNQLINIFNQLIHGMRKNQGNYIDTSKQYKPCHFELRDKGEFWCKEGYVKAYDRYGKCKIIAKCYGDTSFNCYSFIDGNEQLEKYVRNGFPNQYLLDWIHPNAVNGVPLYADVVNENYR